MPRRRKGEERGPITVWPRALPDELGSIPPPESGLSLDPEDIGSQYLRDATEQILSDWPREPDTGEVSIEEDGGGLNGFDEDAFEADPRGWERRITRSLRVGKLRALLPPEPDNDDGSDELLEHEWDELDLTDESVQEASLLDHEGEELGEVESPHLRTDDTHTHGRRRGGHVPKARTMSRRPPPR